MLEKNDLAWIEILDKSIPVPEAMKWLEDSRSGAICTFTGTTREWTGGEQTIKLLYESYLEMAFSEMSLLVKKAFKRWSPNKIALIHRIGEVNIKEASVFVAVSSAHRSDSFEAARFLIDTLKEDVPIWKKEFDPRGDSEWK